MQKFIQFCSGPPKPVRRTNNFKSRRKENGFHCGQDSGDKPVAVKLSSSAIVEIASLTMWIPVKHFLGVLTRALRRARHFAH
jgi:hypothetical protein